MRIGSFEPGHQTRSQRSAIVFTLFMLAVLFSSGSILNTPAALAQLPSATYEEEIATGRDFLKRRRFEDALKSFKRANDLKEKRCAECFYLMANAYMGLEAYKNVALSLDSAIQLAGDDLQLQAQAYNLKGVALQKQADNKDQKKLQDAEAAFRQALALKPDFVEGHYNLGVILMQQNRDSEGIVELKKLLELAPDNPNTAGARLMIANPRRAREPFAPEFSFTTAEGESMSLDELHGKVVLLDFWGTWCPPCVASVPGLRDLNKKFGKNSSFVMISVSSDGNAEKWRAFVAKEKMVWPQYLDSDHRVQYAFNIRAFPTYILLDPDGVIKYRAVGMGLEKEANLADAINKQVKLLTKAGN
jgi:thiol-disulfide isomerase/thioredoxin